VLDRALYVERATTDRERATPLADVDPADVPYFSLALLPSPLTGALPAVSGPCAQAHAGEVAGVGLGPGDRSWTTPGAAEAVAARVGAPLGHDFCVLSLSDVRKPWGVVVDRLRHAAAADLVIALYNPRSKTRPHQLGEAQKVLLENRSPDTVVVVGRDVGGP